MINKDPVFDKMKNFLKVFQVPHVNDLSPTKKRKGTTFNSTFQDTNITY